ncbi:hypothetical protein SDC9_113566 [bioreactor metagenome]|uniref:Uncharacterized protein n=1 Tax=bioreactor metagenome TaxID=1076179 RepID=A0A645BMQ8_9ZZZZ
MSVRCAHTARDRACCQVPVSTIAGSSCSRSASGREGATRSGRGAGVRGAEPVEDDDDLGDLVDQHDGGEAEDAEQCQREQPCDDQQ